MPVHLWLPEAGRGPGILVLQEIFGVSPYIRKRCADLADLGYVVLAPEIYWRLEDNTVDESRPDFLEQGLGIVSRLDWATAVADAVAALARLRELPQVQGRVGIVGFCFGGGLGFSVAAQANPDALVSYYGSALPGLLDLAPQVRCPSLHHFGLADSYIPADVVAGIRDAVTADRDDVDFRTYDGADHAFDNTLPAFHHAQASAAAWPVTTDFLARHLR